MDWQVNWSQNDDETRLQGLELQDHRAGRRDSERRGPWRAAARAMCIASDALYAPYRVCGCKLSVAAQYAWNSAYLCAVRLWGSAQ